MSNPYDYIPRKIDLTPKRYHGYAVVLFIMGTLFPPLAVAARFGIGTDFWINLLLTICGYIPGHGHNFYIQNIRNNKNHARTPKWVQRYGLVDTSEIKRKQRKSQWATRYKDRLPHSALEGQPYEEGQEHGSSVDISNVDGQGNQSQKPNGDLWRAEDESYYTTESNSTSGRWRYPANFDDAALPSASKRGKKKKEKKDRWARTEDAYSFSEEQSQRKRKKKKGRSSMGPESVDSHDTMPEFPEAAEGGLYGDGPKKPDEPHTNGTTDVFEHQF